MTFDDFNFDSGLLESLHSMGFNKPTPIQEASIPVILSDNDLIACAQTGTGKTAAYMLPILHKIIQSKSDTLNTLVLVPTRELALQIDQQIEGFSYFIAVSSIAIYGGGDGATWEQQKRALKEGADIVIATPGRLLAQLQSGAIKMDTIKHLVLDEADRMLDMGFYDDLVRIINYLPATKQTILFSATMPPKIRTLANTFMRKPEQINLALSKPAEGILQQVYMVYDNQKTKLIKHILKTGNFNSIIIFSSTKENVKVLERELMSSGMSVKAFHSDLEQEERESIMRAFKSRQLNLLIGTDILSRGIDIDGIDLVINAEVPGDPENYIHRIGRTARAATTGTAITFVNDKDQAKFFQIENLIGNEIPKLTIPAEIGEGPAYEPEKKVKPSFKPKSKQGFHKNAKVFIEMSGYLVSATEFKTILVLLKREERLLNSFCILDELDSASETARTLQRIRHLIPLIEVMAVHTPAGKGGRGKHISIRLNETQQQDLILVLQKEANNIQTSLQRTVPEAPGAISKKQAAMEVLLKKIQNTSGPAL